MPVFNFMYPLWVYKRGNKIVSTVTTHLGKWRCHYNTVFNPKTYASGVMWVELAQNQAIHRIKNFTIFHQTLHCHLHVTMEATGSPYVDLTVNVWEFTFWLVEWQMVVVKDGCFPLASDASIMSLSWTLQSSQKNLFHHLFPLLWANSYIG
jgi:hypothetical protein